MPVKRRELICLQMLVDVTKDNTFTSVHFKHGIVMNCIIGTHIPKLFCRPPNSNSLNNIDIIADCRFGNLIPVSYFQHSDKPPDPALPAI